MALHRLLDVEIMPRARGRRRLNSRASGLFVCLYRPESLSAADRLDICCDSDGLVRISENLRDPRASVWVVVVVVVVHIYRAGSRQVRAIFLDRNWL